MGSMGTHTTAVDCGSRVARAATAENDNFFFQVEAVKMLHVFLWAGCVEEMNLDV